jgi:putative NIF3 family GTP cyclohydrolase 1 type 2
MEYDIQRLQENRKKSGSSGVWSYAIKNAIMAGADAFLTADLKYHQLQPKTNL